MTSVAQFFGNAPGLGPSSTLALVLADGTAGTAGTGNCPDLVVANTETYQTFGTGPDVVTTPTPARGAGALRCNYNAGTAANVMRSELGTDYAGRVNSWTIEGWARITAFSDSGVNVPVPVFGTCGGRVATGNDLRIGWQFALGQNGVTFSIEPDAQTSLFNTTTQVYAFGTDPAGAGARTHAVFHSSSVATNTWYHLCAQWYSGSNNFRIFIDGVLLGSYTPTLSATGQAVMDTMSHLLAGNQVNYHYGASTDGFLDQLRFSSGLRYPSTGFTVPAGVFVLD